MEFCEQIVALARSGRSVEALAREFELCAATIHDWLKQTDREGGYRADGMTSEELRRLRRHRARAGPSGRIVSAGPWGSFRQSLHPLATHSDPFIDELGVDARCATVSLEAV